MTSPEARHLGFFGATSIGVGAIVGGGILALAGVAFSTAGPAALVAFMLNGVIAFLTAASFAELAVRFPQSGGTYTYAKRVLSIEVAFVVGWVVWFASIMAGVLYALGFAVFAAEGATRLLTGAGIDAPWLGRSELRIGLALAAAGFYAAALMRRAAGGGQAATVGKVLVFAVLIGGGLVAALRAPSGQIVAQLDPFFAGGTTGVLQAMGYTFIALQGFDLIAAVAGEVRDPQRNLPRAMYISLAAALAIYLPLLFVITTVGTSPGVGIMETARANPESIVATAAERFLGTSGYWLVIGAGVLSMLSALQANLLGASRVAFAMARDRTLPRPLGRMRGVSATPVIAVAATVAMLAFVVVAVGDVSSAGAASSLIFLVSFAMVHWAAILARRRSADRRVPIVPILGASSCIALAVFQAFAVPEAGTIVASWLVIGVALYLTLLAPGARLADVTAEARDPQLALLRGRSPLVLVPIANPASAASLAGVAATVKTPGAGRVLLLSVVRTPAEAPDEDHPAMRDAETILGESLLRGFERATPAETLFTIADDQWSEIERVARLHRCETVVLGAPSRGAARNELEALIPRLDGDVVLVRAPRRWRIADVRRVLVPLGGLRDHSPLRARLLASLTRTDECAITFLRIIDPGTDPGQRRYAAREARALARDEAAGRYDVLIEETDDVPGAILRHASEMDLVVLGIPRGRGGVFGPVVGELADRCAVPLILISSRSSRRHRPRQSTDDRAP